MAGKLAQRVALGITNPKGTQTTVSDEMTTLCSPRPAPPPNSESSNLTTMFYFSQRRQDFIKTKSSLTEVSSLYYTLCSSSSPWKMLVSYLPDRHCGRKDDYKLGLSLEEEHTRPQLAKPWCTDEHSRKDTRHINITRWNSTVTSHRNTCRYSTNCHKCFLRLGI